MEPTKRNPPWQRDELILALDVYFRCPPSSTSESHPEIIELSKLLNLLPIHTERANPEKFRNPTGVYMKLCNFLRLDPTYKGKGLDAGSKMDEVIWNEFAGDQQHLHEVALRIRSSLSNTDMSVHVVPPEEETEFPEGKVLFRMHQQRERSGALVERAKTQRLQKTGKLTCEVCGFDFGQAYGCLGEGYIEAHHVRPVSELGDGEKTKISDLALVCSNCHRMLHRRRPWLSVAELGKLVGTN